MAMAMAIVGGVISAVGAVAQASAAAKASEYNAKLEERKAVIAKQNALAEEQAKRRETKMLLGKSRANIGASGVEAVGTPLDVLTETAALGELDALTIRYGGENAAEGYRSNAELDRMKASAARTQGFVGAAGALIGGIGNAIRI